MTSIIVPASYSEVATASGVWPAEWSVWTGGAEQPATSVEVQIAGEPPPPPVTWVKPKMGVIGDNEANFNTINNAVGQGVVRRTYNSTLPASWAASNAASDVAAGRESYWSWKPSVTGFPTSTSQKSAFSAFLDTIPDGHKAVIMAWHEPENDIPTNYSLAQWGLLQDTIASLVKANGNPDLRTGFCLMGPWTFDTRNTARFGWPWDTTLNFELIDIIGIDPYRTQSGSSMSLQTLLTVNNSGSGTGGSAPSMIAKLESWGKPISLMEWGAYNSTEASVATFITQAYAWMKTYNQSHLAAPIESAMWFNLTLIGSDNPLTGVEVPAYAATVADSKIPPI